MSDEERELSRDDLEKEGAAELPDREAMSVITAPATMPPTIYPGPEPAIDPTSGGASGVGREGL